MRMHLLHRGVTILALLVVASAVGDDKAPAAKGAAADSQLPVILLTGFEPFGPGRPANPSWEGVKPLDGQTWNGHKLVARQLPVIWGQPMQKLQPLIDELHPVAVFSFGQGGGFTIEVKAANRRGGGRDNDDARPASPTITEDGPTEFAASIDAAELVRLLGDKGYPIRISTRAGAYLCEECLYTLEYLKDKKELKGTTVLFSHVPALNNKNVTPEYIQQYVLDMLEAWKTVYRK